MADLFTELKRRNVFRVGAAYAIVGWLLVEVSSVLLPAFKVPEWVFQAFVILVVLGFPLTLVIAWAFEMTPEGLKREAEVDRTESITHVTGRKLDFIIIGILAVAVVYFAVNEFVLEAEPEQTGVTADSVPTAEAVSREKSIRSLAVLPLENLSGDPDQEYFSDAMSNELIRELMKIRSLRLPAWTTVRRYKDSPKNARQIANELGVAGLVEGLVYREGNQIRITVQLIDARDDRHIWAESFDRDFEQLLSLQREVAREVAAAVEIQLTRQEKQTLSATARIDSEALDAYITGVYYLGQSGTEGELRAIEQFEKAVQKEPGFAQAYAMLARAYLVAGMGYAQLTREDSIQKARNAAREALTLDDSLPIAHSVWGSIAFREREWDRAEKSLRRGYELAPNDPRTMTFFANYLTLASRHAEAIALGEAAVAAAPNDLNIRNGLAIFLYVDHQFDRALEQARQLHEMDPDGSRDKWLSYFIYSALGEKEEALRNFIEGMRHNDPESFWVVTAEHGLESGGADGAIRELATMASERVREHGDAAFELGLESIELAFQLAMIGEVDSMFEWLERGNRLRESNAIWACVDPVFDPYRSDPRFVDLLERITCPGG